MESPVNKLSWTRTLTVAFLGFLGFLVVASFYNKSPAFSITADIVIVLAIMTILVLSEAFNSFSLGKILTLSKEVSKSAQENNELKSDNTELRNTIVKLAVNVHQSQLNTTINTSGMDLLNALGVVKAETTDKHIEQEPEQSTVAPETISPTDKKSTTISLNTIRMAESLAFEKYIDANSIQKIDMERDIQFSHAFENIDPVMERRINFDGYMKKSNKEYFFEVRSLQYMGSPFFDRLYVMISKIMFYRDAKKIPAELILIIAIIPDKEYRLPYYERYLKNLIYAVQPAIAGGLLRVEQIEITEEELEVLIKQDQTQQKSNSQHG